MNQKEIVVTKMHGAGNDFVLIDGADINEKDLSALALKLCDRHFGIGADGLLVILPSEKADAKMRIFNSDGSEAQMCGNGIRCIGKYLYDNRRITTLQPVIDTLSGTKKLDLHLGSDGSVESVTVDMGEAHLLSDSLVKLTMASGEFNIIPVSTGNPHCIVEVDDAQSLDVAKIGSHIENHPYWPEKTNVEFVTVDSTHSITQRTWERGVGETLACGTGACASAFALTVFGRTEWPVNVKLPGGTLIIDSINDHLMMTGPAVMVFQCKISV